MNVNYIPGSKERFTNTRINLFNNKEADMGIGTLIIFIAMVLVAAVAAAVLIQSSGILQQKAQQTGSEATIEVSSSMKIISIAGEREDAGSTTPVSILNITIQLSSGSYDVDLKEVVVKYINETISTKLTHNSATAGSATFDYSEIRDISGTTDVLSSGDLGVITINLSATGQQLLARKRGTIHIIPESGVMVIKDIKAPATYGILTRIQLFP